MKRVMREITLRITYLTDWLEKLKFQYIQVFNKKSFSPLKIAK